MESSHKTRACRGG